MEKIIIINKTNGFYSKILDYKFKIEFETINFYLNENLNKSALKRIKPWMWRRNINSISNNQ